MYFIQQWYGLADKALMDAIYDNQVLRGFPGIDLGRDSVPAATKLLQFRRLMVNKDLTAMIYESVKA